MGRHVARTASLGSFIGLPQRAMESAEPRGRLFGRRAVLPPEPVVAEPALSIIQTMAILELIAERRTRAVGVSLGLVDRIQTLS